MEVETLEVPKEKAVELYDDYKEAIQTHKDQYLKDLKAIYGHMKLGRSVIDIYQAFNKVGLNEEGDPKLAIVRADLKEVFFKRLPEGAGIFKKDTNRWKNAKDDVQLPKETWTDWPRVSDARFADIKKEFVTTITPIIPAKFLDRLRGALHNYYILWEVEKWKPIPPKDPILLKRVTPNMFVVLATWDLTDLERAVIKGRIPL